MSGAGRGVTPGAEPEAGLAKSAASAVPGQGQPVSPDNGSQTSGLPADGKASDGRPDGPAAQGTADGAAGPAKADGAAGPAKADASPDGGKASEAAAAGSEPAGSGAGGRGPAGGRGTAGQRKRKKRSFWREFPILVVIALVLAVVIKTYAIQAFFIPSGSMENTLKINDRVLVNKLVYDVRGIHRGDIVVFNGAGSWDPGTVPASTNFAEEFVDGFASMFGFGRPGDILIKRVIGLPGDHVACCDAQGRVTVNGVPLTEQSYLYPGDVPSEVRFNIVVRPGRLWVMGDHRLISDDSRGHLGDPGGGTIPQSAVIGRAFVIIWPPSRWGFLPIPVTFEQPKLNSPATAAAASPPNGSAGAADLLSARLQPAGSALPLSLGFAAAIPVTWLQRRVRIRFARRRAASRGGGQVRDGG